jgi:2-C-methyl-D-erythritol 4-phosphate cytidylyltransferase
MNSAIIVAAGRGQRMGLKTDKAFLNLGPKPVVAWSLLAFEACQEIDRIVLVIRKEQLVAARTVAQMFGISKLHAVAVGGSSRQDSVLSGLRELDPDTRYVCVHDGARPCVTPELIQATLRCAKRHGSGIAASRVWDTVKYVERGTTVDHTVDRTKLWTVQTPQTFSVGLLTRAYKEVTAKKASVTDDAAAIELLGEAVRLVEWSKPNIKITIADDLALAAAALQIC